jgi:fructokinase
MKPELKPANSVIYAVGETVFDIIFKEYEPMAAKPGGSAFNAMISLGRIGIPASFISEVGNDKIGNFIINFLKENGVENEYVVKFEDGKSALSLAFLNESSDAEYDFYKDYPNQRLNEDMPVFGGADFFLFGSFYGLNPVLRPQIKKLLKAANEAGSLVFYDPNFRSSHLDDLDLLRDIIEENFRYSTIVRASNEDLYNIYRVENARDAWALIKPFCSCFIYTANEDGVDLFTENFEIHMDVDRIIPLSTIGAGDTYNSGILYGLYKNSVNTRNLKSLSVEQWKEILRTAGLFSREVCLSYDNYISKDFAEKYSV